VGGSDECSDDAPNCENDICLGFDVYEASLQVVSDARWTKVNFEIDYTRVEAEFVGCSLINECGRDGCGGGETPDRMFGSLSLDEEARTGTGSWLMADGRHDSSCGARYGYQNRVIAYCQFRVTRGFQGPTVAQFRQDVTAAEDSTEDCEAMTDLPNMVVSAITKR